MGSMSAAVNGGPPVRLESHVSKWNNLSARKCYSFNKESYIYRLKSEMLHPLIPIKIVPRPHVKLAHGENLRVFLDNIESCSVVECRDHVEHLHWWGLETYTIQRERQPC